MSASPQPPTDVRLVSPGGVEQSVELVHVGFDAEGMAVWSNVRPLPDGFGRGWRVTCAVLPARTTIQLGTRQ